MSVVSSRLDTRSCRLSDLHACLSMLNVISSVLIVLLPRGSTLFPYTTLFRSASVEDKQILKGINLDIQPGEVHAIMGPNGDRKSTRLNSSHVAISYAVFCLKKITKPTYSA